MIQRTAITLIDKMFARFADRRLSTFPHQTVKIIPQINDLGDYFYRRVYH